jgi:hypothetical protein
VSRDGCPGGWEPIGDFAGSAWSSSEELEDLATGGVGEGAEDGVHVGVRASIRYLANYLILWEG